jgi:alkanesulfonate monooxygenase SsuD/methylene tetrahydromethanopterin reductase-like flavin-dependent oxidoreductase (luciferase family)
MTVKLGVTLPQFTSDPGHLLQAALRAEEVGLDSVWLFDHMWPLSGGKERPILEQWSTLAYLAARTERVTIGTLVTRTSLRHPALLAKMAATVATIARGRFVVTLGSGDSLSRGENDAFGLPYYGGDRRVDQLASTASLLRSFLGARDRVSQLDEFAAITELPPSPAPAPPPPIWMAGNSAFVAAAARSSADGWNAWGKDASWLGQRADELGTEGFEISWGGIGTLDGAAGAPAGPATASAPRHVTGPPEAFAETLRGLADAGAGHLMITFPRASREVYERFASEVAPLVRGPS